jgi:hypothetical protein
LGAMVRGKAESTATTSAGILGFGARRIRHLHSRGVRAGPRRSADLRPRGEGEEVGVGGGIRGARSTAGGERRDGGAQKTRHARASGPSVLIRRSRMVSGTRVTRRLISAVRSATSGADSDRTAGDMAVRSPRNSSFRRLPAVRAVHLLPHRMQLCTVATNFFSSKQTGKRRKSSRGKVRERG